MRTGRVLSGYELRSWLHPHGCRTCSRCTQGAPSSLRLQVEDSILCAVVLGCIFAARADDGKVPHHEKVREEVDMLWQIVNSVHCASFDWELECYTAMSDCENTNVIF